MHRLTTAAASFRPPSTPEANVEHLGRETRQDAVLWAYAHDTR